MASTNVITSLGAADVDTKELAANLVAATKEPRQKLIDAERKKAEVAISSAALLKSGLSALQEAATDISSVSKLNNVQVSSSNSSVATASSVSTATATAGTYSITVESLATPKTVITSFSRTFSAPAGATISLTIPNPQGGEGFSGDIAVGGKNPSQIVTAISAWVKQNAPTSQFSAMLVDTKEKVPKDPPRDNTLVEVEKPLKIVLKGAPGIDNSFQLTGALNSAITTTTEATNSKFTVNGIPVERSSNNITDVVRGLSIGLSAVSASPVVISAKPDPSIIIDNIRNFVDTFNTVTEFIKKAIGPKVAGDDVAGSLQNDATARGVLAQLRSKITSKFTELNDKPISITHLSSLGLELDRNGVLKFDKVARFTAAYEDNPADVVTALSNDAPSPYLSARLPSGLAGDMARLAYDLAGASDSTVPMMGRGYEGKIERIDKKQAALDAYIERVRAQYDKQFSALNAVLASFKNTSVQLEKSLNLNNNN